MRGGVEHPVMDTHEPLEEDPVQVSKMHDERVKGILRVSALIMPVDAEVPSVQLVKLRWWSVNEVSVLSNGRNLPVFVRLMLVNDVYVIVTDSVDVEEFVKENKVELIVVERPVNCEWKQVKFHLKMVSADGRMKEHPTRPESSEMIML